MTAEVEKMKLHKRVTRAHATQVRIIVLTGTKTQHVAVELQKSPLKRSDEATEVGYGREPFLLYTTEGAGK